MNNEVTEENLLSLYNKTSKHSNYQVIASCLKPLLPTVTVTSRFENERLKYINSVLSFKDKRVVDIGGNTGFFTMEAITQKAKKVTFVEGNLEHAEFVKAASDLLGFSGRINVLNQYLHFKDDLEGKFDIGFLLNVLHHIGDDYGEASKQQDVLGIIISSLIDLSTKVKVLIFQLGFNWKGDIKYPLFEHGSKEEVIDFIRSSVSNYYDIKQIGIAEKAEKNVGYHNLNSSNLPRDNTLGEFLNRPIFILESKIYID